MRDREHPAGAHQPRMHAARGIDLECGTHQMRAVVGAVDVLGIPDKNRFGAMRAAKMMAGDLLVRMRVGLGNVDRWCGNLALMGGWNLPNGRLLRGGAAIW